MGQAKLRRQRTETPDAAARFLASKSADRVYLLGPVCWQPSDGTAARSYYFVVATGDRAGEAHFDQIITKPSAHEGDAMRARLLIALKKQTPCVIHLFEDELDMVSAADELWPCEKTKRIRETIEAEPKATRRDRGQTGTPL